jgi:hypothetical protein
MKHRIGFKQTAVELADGSFAQQNMSAVASALVTHAASVGTTATKIVDRNELRCWIEIVNNGSGVVYLGDEAVTGASGFPLKAGATIRVDTANEVWAVAGTGTVDLRALELSN